MTYLRAGRIVLPEDEGSLEMLLEEAEFYQVKKKSSHLIFICVPLVYKIFTTKKQ